MEFCGVLWHSLRSSGCSAWWIGASVNEKKAVLPLGNDEIDVLKQNMEIMGTCKNSAPLQRTHLQPSRDPKNDPGVSLHYSSVEGDGGLHKVH